MSNYFITQAISNLTFISCLPSTKTYYQGESTLEITSESDYGTLYLRQKSNLEVGLLRPVLISPK